MRGLHASGMAEHHAIHLQEFAEREGITAEEVGTENLSDLYSVAFMIVPEQDSEMVQKSLRPHRVEVVGY